MAEKEPPASEGEAVAAFLSELGNVHEVKEIAGWETGFAALSFAPPTRAPDRGVSQQEDAVLH